MSGSYYIESSNRGNVNEALDQAELYRDQALQSSVDAAASAASALSSATSADTDATAAAASASSANSGAASATNSASDASTSAFNAATSATNAATSATSASTSETNAANSATTASSAASTATTKASEASTSATNAANSASGAASSAVSAANSASSASGSATSATTSATNAANSATAAGTSETNAANSATAAAGSATSAATSAAQAASDAAKSVAFKNKIINGDCRIAQRGSVAVTNATFQYGGPDRHISNLSATTASGTILQGTSDLPFTASGYIFGVNSATTTGSTTGSLGQRIESLNTKDLVGKIVTISCKVYHDFGTAVNWNIALSRANTTDNFSATTAIGSSSPVSVASGVVTELTFTTPVLTLANVQNGLQVLATFGPTSALTNKSYFYSELQLEVGSIKTPFEHRPIGVELSQCQRYYQVASLEFSGYVVAGSSYLVRNPFAVPMRTAPTVVFTSTSAIGFPGTSGTASAGMSTIAEIRTADSNNNAGRFGSSYTASAEL